VRRYGHLAAPGHNRHPMRRPPFATVVGARNRAPRGHGNRGHPAAPRRRRRGGSG
jgi:hypothetical protein